MTSPSGEQQEQLLKTVYENAGIDASEIDYIEAHGRAIFVIIFKGRTLITILGGAHFITNGA